MHSIKKNQKLILLYLIAFAQIASIGIFNDIQVGGRPVHAYVRYFMYIVVIWSSVVCIFKQPQYRLSGILILVYFIFAITYSYIQSNDLMNTTIESSRYVTIVLIYYWVALKKPTFRQITHVIYVIMPFLLITTFLSSMGYLRGIQDASGGILRNSSDVDGTIGVVATLVSLHNIFAEDGYPVKIVNYIEFIISMIVIGFSLSRARIACFLLCLIIYFIVTRKYSKRSKFKNLLPIIIILMILVVLFTETIVALINQITIRFGIIREDINLLRRNAEIEQHMMLLKNNILFGVGWGTFYKYGISDHCSYTAIFAYLGLFGGIIYNLWFVSVLYQCIKRVVRERKISNCHLALVVVIGVLILAYGNMAFNKTGGIVGMLVVYTALLENTYDNTTSREIVLNRLTQKQMRNNEGII